MAQIHELGADLAALRRRLGVSQVELAARMGTTQSAVARLESGGRSPNTRTVERAYQALGYDVDVRAYPMPLTVAEPRATYAASGVDLSLIRSNLKMPPARRLAHLESFVRSVDHMRRHFG